MVRRMDWKKRRGRSCDRDVKHKLMNEKSNDKKDLKERMEGRKVERKKIERKEGRKRET